MFTRKITRPNTQDCVTALLKTMELPINYHKNRNLNTDLLFMKEIQMFVLSSTEEWYTHFETLFYEQRNYILIIFQQIIQSRRFKKLSTVLKGLLNISLHIDLTKYITDQQEHTTNDTRKAMNELLN